MALSGCFFDFGATSSRVLFDIPWIDDRRYAGHINGS